MVAETETCSSCNGSGTVRAVVSRRGKPCVETDVICSSCEGAGWLSHDHLRRIDEGRRMREARLASGKTIAERAGELGLTPAQLSRRERGKL